MFPPFLLFVRARRPWLPLVLILMLSGLQWPLLAHPEHAHTQSAGSAVTDAATNDTFTMLNWATRTPAPTGLSEAQTVTINGKVYSFGGFYDSDFHATARVDVYDPVTDSWTSKGNMPTVLTHAGLATDGQAVYVIGGYVGDHPGPATADTWKYDVAGNTWTPFVALPEPRGAGAAVLLGREIHFFGGMDVTRTINQNTHYVLNLDEAAPTWRTLAPLPVARNHLGGAVLGGKIYALGGQLNEESSAVPQSVVHAYDPATNAWTQVASLPKNRSQHGAGTFVHGNRIIAVGGEDKVARPLADVTAYDPITNTWTALSPLPEARRSGIAGSTGDTLIYSQGWTPNVQKATTWSGVPGTVNELRVNGGSYPGYVDTAGQFWAADANYNTGSIARTSNPIALTNDDWLYQTEHAGNFNYTFPVANGNYTLRLHFAELYFTSPGQRKFNVIAEGQTVLSNYDIVARSGAINTAIVETVAVTISDGKLDMSFSGVVSTAKISAFELIPAGGSGTLTVTRVQGDGQTGTVGSTLPQPLIVEVKNSAGTLQSGIPVSFAATNGSVSPGSVTTGSDGRASTTLTLGASSGTATVTASASGAVGTSFTATATAIASAPASKLALSPSSGTVGVGTQVTYQVSVQDQSGNTVTSPNQTVTFALSGVSGSFSPSATATTGNGTASVTLTATTAGSATVSASAAGLTGASASLVVTSGAPPTSFVAAFNSGGPSYTSVSGSPYAADAYFSGGRTSVVTSNPIAATNDDTLYQTERSAASFSYAVPVANGSYSLRLHFAEIYWNNVGQRVFNVSAEGQAVLSNYDILARAGAKYAAVVETIPVTVSDGVLNLSFAGVVGNAKISAFDLSPAVVEDHFLHVVIGAPPYAVDYDANGSESVSLKGSDSHTHQIGRQLTGWTWQDGQTVFGTQPNTATSLSLGNHTVSLTITDDNAPPQTLSGSVLLPVYAKNAVGGVFAGYYPSSGIPLSTLIDSLPTAPSYLEVLPGLAVNATSGKVGGSPYTGNLVTVLTGTYNAAAVGSYQFSSSGGLDRRLYVDGAPVSGPLNLSAGPHAIEARFSVDTTAVLPTQVLVAVNGGAATPVPTADLRHDESNLLPFINSMPTTGAGAGGESVTIRGIGFFPAGSVQVHWGSTVLSGTAISVAPDAITLVTPPGSNTVAVTVQTPNGSSNAVNFTYNSSQAAISFTTRYVTDTPSPTQAAWGPDGRLYVLSITGSLNIYTFNDNYSVTATQVVNTLTTLPNSNTVGIAFNPHDPTDKIRIYVAHALLFAQGGTCPTGPFAYNGQVSVLEGPDFSVVRPLVTGLGVANYDHSINSLAFDDNGDLLIANGSATNAGIADCDLGGLPESPLSAAILKAQVSKSGFNGTLQYVESATGLTNNDERSGEVVDLVAGADVSLFAAGLRNPFDLVWTTRGRLYGTDNGANSGFGAASTSATTQSPDEPTAPDEINLLQQGNYYGHPNRNRGRADTRQNVYHYGSEGSIAGVYTAPLVTLASSSDGIDEYRATTFNSQMRGNLLVQKYRGNTFSARLSADGAAISEVTTIQGGPTTGLDVLAGPGGAILSFNYDGDVINLSRPNDTTAPPMVAYDIFPFRAKRDGARTFTIGGVGFGTPGDTTVTIGGVQAVLTSVSSTRIRGLIPASSNPAADYLDVVVQSAGRQSAIPAAFRYLGSP